ncbi:threonylcarbamoyl-AMP synthase [Halobacteriales archaeon QS_8_69_26]|nr:MAG: threonylcarbamoyl-AMP synthase [Halobacteriales archaeon QS_8_69_26]
MTDADVPGDPLDRAARAIREGELVVYPTETVYGLGADALSPDAVERVFAAKGRDRSKPVSMAVPSVDRALAYVDPTPETERFMRAFLPGPVTVVCRRGPDVPDVLTAGSDRVGVRVPDHELSLSLADRAGTPVTATSANRSGAGSARRVAGVDPSVRDAAAVVIDAGETPGGGSTVVDVDAGDVIRRGAMADEIAAWLAGE